MAQKRVAACRGSEKSVTGDILTKLLATCASDRLFDLRDRAQLNIQLREENATLRLENTRLKVEN
jgi:hypothetical protein